MGHFSWVQSDKLVEAILDVCETLSDDWSFTVKGRIEYYSWDLHVADGLYHHFCTQSSRTFRAVPLELENYSNTTRRKIGRTKDEDKEEVLEKMCLYRELNSEEQLGTEQ